MASFPYVYPNDTLCCNSMLFFLFLNINGSIFFISAALLSTVPAGIVSPLSHLFAFNDRGYSRCLSRLMPSNPSISLEDADTFRLRFPGQAQQCCTEHPLVLESTPLSHPRQDPTSSHHNMMLWALFAGSLQRWLLPSPSLGS